MRQLIRDNKCIFAFALVLICFLATREEGLVKNEQGITPNKGALTDTSINYTFKMQRDYDALIKKRIEGYDLRSSRKDGGNTLTTIDSYNLDNI